MIIAKNLEWTRDFIKSVSHLLPNLKYLKKIGVKYGNKEKWQHCHGLITYVDGRHYRITLYLTYHDQFSDKIRPYSTLDLLQYLAHELSHLQHWEHTPDHKLLECIILQIFMVKLKESGYISEEEEFKNLKHW
jgi:hypothetical protein